MNVEPDTSFDNIKIVVEADIQVPPAAQHFYHNQQLVTDTTKTLEEMGIGEGEMLGMKVEDPSRVAPSRAQGQQQSSIRPSGQRQQQGPDGEQMRLHILGDSRMLAEVRRQDPELADAASNRERFHTLWDQRRTQAAQAEAEKNAQIALLNADPFNMEAQRKIEEMIQQEQIQANIQKALEDNPECKSET